eukprot:gene41502-biopygen59368
MREQKAAVEAAIDMAGRVTKHMSLYQVEDAHTIVDGSQGDALPHEMRTAFRVLVENLCLYRPYLPRSLLLDDIDFDQEEDVQEQPPTPRGTIAIMFTDIVGSTDEVNPVTERIDYRGKCVNLASRCESQAPHGAVNVSEECYAAVKSETCGNGRLAAEGYHAAEGTFGTLVRSIVPARRPVTLQVTVQRAVPVDGPCYNNAVVACIRIVVEFAFALHQRIVLSRRGS